MATHRATLLGFAVFASCAQYHPVFGAASVYESQPLPPEFDQTEAASRARTCRAGFAAHGLSGAGAKGLKIGCEESTERGKAGGEVVDDDDVPGPRNIIGDVSNGLVARPVAIAAALQRQQQQQQQQHRPQEQEEEEEEQERQREDTAAELEQPEEEMTIDLYGLPVSPPCVNVIMLSKYLGIRLNIKPVNPGEGDNLKPEYLKMNPQHTIPTIDDNGFILWESRAIMVYLVMKYAKNDSLYPSDPQKRALIEQMMYFDTANLYNSIISYHGPVIFGLVDVPPVEKYGAMERAFGVLDSSLESRDFVAGDDLTVADFSLITSTCAAKAFGFDVDRYERVSAWYERCKSLLEKHGFEETTEAGMQGLGDYYRSKLRKDEETEEPAEPDETA